MQRAEILCSRCGWRVEAVLGKPPEAYSERLEEGHLGALGGLLEEHFEATRHGEFQVQRVGGVKGIIETPKGNVPRYARKSFAQRHKEFLENRYGSFAAEMRKLQGRE